LFSEIIDFDWDEWKAGKDKKEKKERLCSPLRVWEILADYPDGLTKKDLCKKIQQGGVTERTAYRSIKEAQKVHAINIGVDEKFTINPDYEPETDV